MNALGTRDATRASSLAAAGEVDQLLSLVDPYVQRAFKRYQLERSNGVDTRSLRHLRFLDQYHAAWTSLNPSIERSLANYRDKCRVMFARWTNAFKARRRRQRRRVGCGANNHTATSRLDVIARYGRVHLPPAQPRNYCAADVLTVNQHDTLWNCADCAAHSQISKVDILPDATLFGVELHPTSGFHSALIAEFGTNLRFVQEPTIPSWMPSIDLRLFDFDDNVGQHASLLFGLAHLLDTGSLMTVDEHRRVSATMARGRRLHECALARYRWSARALKELNEQWDIVESRPILAHLRVFAGNASYILDHLFQHPDMYLVLPWSCLCTRRALCNPASPYREPYTNSWKPLQNALRRYWCCVDGELDQRCYRYLVPSADGDYAEALYDTASVRARVSVLAEQFRQRHVARAEMSERVPTGLDRRGTMLANIEHKYEQWQSVQNFHSFHKIHRHLIVVFRNGVTMRSFRDQFQFLDHPVPNVDRKRSWKTTRLEIFRGNVRTLGLDPILSANALLNATQYVANPLPSKYATNDNTRAYNQDDRTYNDMRHELYDDPDDPNPDEMRRAVTAYKTKLWEENHFYFSCTMRPHAVEAVRSYFESAVVEQIVTNTSAKLAQECGAASRAIKLLRRRRAIDNQVLGRSDDDDDDLLLLRCRALLSSVDRSERFRQACRREDQTVRQLVSSFPEVTFDTVRDHLLPGYSCPYYLFYHDAHLDFVVRGTKPAVGIGNDEHRFALEYCHARSSDERSRLVNEATIRTRTSRATPYVKKRPLDHLP